MLYFVSRIKQLSVVLILFIFLCSIIVHAQTKSDMKKLFYEGSALLEKGDTGGAIKKFEKGYELSIKFNNVQAQSVFLGNMGQVYWQVGDLKKALQYTEKAYEISSKNADKTNSVGWLGNLGGINSAMGNYEKAMENYEKALLLSRELSDSRLETNLMANIGRLLFVQDKINESMAYFKKALEIADKAKYKNGRIIILQNMGELYIKQEDYKNALETYSELHTLCKDSDSPDFLCASLIYLANVQVKLGDYTEAGKNLEKALQIVKDEKHRGVVLGNLGSVFMESGRHTEALDKYEKALEISVKSRDKTNEIKWLSGLGTFYSRDGEYNKAFQYYEKALSLAREANDRDSESIQLNNIGALYLDLGEPGKALDYFRTSLSITGDSRHKAVALENIGAAYARKDEPKAALVYYTKAMEIFRKLGDRRHEAVHLKNIGDTHTMLDDYDSSMKIYKKALGISRELKDLRIEGRILGGMGSAQLKSGNYKEALDCLDKALEISIQTGDRTSQFAWNYGKGLCYKRLKKNSEAIECLKRSIAIIEEIRGSVKVEELKTSFMKKYINVYELLIEMLIQEGKAEEAFNYAERAKARNFLDSLGNKRIIPNKSGDVELAEKERTLRTQIHSLESAVIRIKPEDHQIMRNIQMRMKVLQEEYFNVIEKLKTSNPAYSSLITINPFSLREIQGVLKPDETIIEYFTGENLTYIWIITSGKIDVVVIQENLKTIARRVNRLRSSMLLKPNEKVDDEKVNEYRKQLSEFYTLILKPVENNIASTGETGSSEKNSGKGRIFIVPHGSLHYIPFSALIDNNGKHLIESYSIVTEPSASSFVLFRKRESKKLDNFAGFALGNINKFQKPDLQNNPVNIPDEEQANRQVFVPLPGTKEEVEKIAAILKEKQYELITCYEKDFLAEKVEKESSTAGILHIATHGFFSSRAKGRFSGLIASDGYIFIIDIFNWKMDANLVVLSACETGLGRILEGDEMVGLSRAFMQAGTDNLIATLWNVQDKSTGDLMISFYRGILSGENVSHSLRNAQLELMKSYPHPFYWAPFIIFGKG